MFIYQPSPLTVKSKGGVSELLCFIKSYSTQRVSFSLTVLFSYDQHLMFLVEHECSYPDLVAGVRRKLVCGRRKPPERNNPKSINHVKRLAFTNSACCSSPHKIRTSYFTASTADVTHVQLSSRRAVFLFCSSKVASYFNVYVKSWGRLLSGSWVSLRGSHLKGEDKQTDD